jgi:hypothetical protein
MPTLDAARSAPPAVFSAARCRRLLRGLVAAALAAALWVGLGAGPARAQDPAAGAFARLGVDARGMALGNALAANPAGDVSPYYNPALSPRASGQRLSASAALMSFDRELQFLEFTTPLGPTAGIGVGVIHAGVSNIDGRSENGTHTETLSTDEFGVLLGFGNQFADRFSLGATLKLYQADYIEEVRTARSFGLDLGASVQATERLTLGLVVNDLLAKYEWSASGSGQGGGNTDRFPTRVRLGGHHSFQGGRLQVMAEVETRITTSPREIRSISTGTPVARPRIRTEEVRQADVRGRFGVAYRLVDIFTLRAGADRVGVDGVSGLRPSAGFGLRQTLGNLRLRIGYAAVLEPYVNDAMNTATLQIYL